MNVFTTLLLVLSVTSQFPTDKWLTVLPLNFFIMIFILLFAGWHVHIVHTRPG